MTGLPPLLKFASHLSAAWTPLLPGPTPVHRFHGADELLEHPQLYIKREDLTDHRYGGNKVRNLEFLLGDALRRGARRVVTVAPLGSNFVGALAAQAERLGMLARVFHFVPAASPQIDAHYRFSQARGADLRITSGHPYVGAVRAWASLRADLLQYSGGYALAPGGSSPLGALGHVNAAQELAAQVVRGEIPEPDVIVAGVGTCGTMAGLLAGLRLTGLSTRVVGVRCVDRVVCHPARIARLANRTLRLLDPSARFRPLRASDVDLRDPPGARSAYGAPLLEAHRLIREIRASAGITLDTTYTSKVMSFLKHQVGTGAFRRQTVLYWNTFSPAALAAPANSLPAPPVILRTGRLFPQ